MAKRETGELAQSNLNGDKLYLKRARLVLPYLVRQAKANQPIYYSDLASEIGISNPRNLNYVLGAVGNAIKKLSMDSGVKIPPIQYVVINKKDEMPGEGIGWFTDIHNFNTLSQAQKQKVIMAQLTSVFAFDQWDWVLSQFELVPLQTSIAVEMEKARYPKGGESEAHRILKEFIATNPERIGLSKKILKSEVEYKLPSTDCIDILFFGKDERIGVEVKSIVSDVPDILRGIFQCVKYKYLIEAEQTVLSLTPNSKVILALEGPLPANLIPIKNILGVEVVENVRTNIC